MQLGIENYLLKPINQRELNDTLTKTLENLEQDQMAASIHSSDILAFRNNILDRWVNGTIQDFELYERAELLDINLSAPEYMVCVLDIVHPDNMDQRFRYSSSLLGVCRSILSSSYSAECFLDGSFRVVAILNGKSLKHTIEELRNALQTISEEMAPKDIRFFSSVGPVSSSSIDVSISYVSALFYQNYRFLDPSSAIIVCDEFPNSRQGAPDEPQTMLLQFNKALIEENFRQSISIAQKFIQQYYNKPLSGIKQHILPFLLSLVKTMIESGRKTDQLPKAILTQLLDFTKIESYDSFETWLFKTIQNSLKVINDRKGSLHLLVRLVLDQVNNKYNTDLSLKTLAAGFNVSPAYLGQLFKEEIGKYFNDYLTDIRLQVSKNLLLETDLKIGEITRRIGIFNQSYYNRVFKKAYGISPVEYRHHNKQL